ncbi:hypothetical protein BDFB_013991, partial [Asbolus verrucosus]
KSSKIKEFSKSVLLLYFSQKAKILNSVKSLVKIFNAKGNSGSEDLCGRNHISESEEILEEAQKFVENMQHSDQKMFLIVNFSFSIEMESSSHIWDCPTRTPTQAIPSEDHHIFYLSVQGLIFCG